MTAADVLSSSYTFFAIIALTIAVLVVGSKTKDSPKKNVKKK